MRDFVDSAAESVVASMDATLGCPASRHPDDTRAEIVARARNADVARALDRAASEFMDVLSRELPAPLRNAVLVALRATAGAEALAEALAEGVVREVGP